MEPLYPMDKNDRKCQELTWRIEMNGPQLFIQSIYIAPHAGAPMQRVKCIEAIAGRGLIGDRYTGNAGSWSKQRNVIRHVSFIDIEQIIRGNLHQHSAGRKMFLQEETRRQIVLVGTGFKILAERTFRIGEARFRFVEQCTPCNRPSVLVKKPGFMESYREHGAGIRTEILNSGFISENDPVIIE